MDWIVAEYRRSSGLDLSKDKMAIQRLREAAEKAKIELSSVQETSINLPFITVGPGGPAHLEMKLSRAKLEQMIAPIVERTMAPVKRALEDSMRSAKEIAEVVLVGGSTRIPLVKKTVTEFFGRDPHQGVNPDEVVAVGAAVQAGVLSGEVGEMVLLDVTPLSLGIETLGGVMTVMIPRNTTIPTRKKEIFSTAADSQPSVEVHVLQGERTEARYNRTLGKFHLDGILPAPRGIPKIEVAFDIDANGILSVNAKDTATGKDQKITITAHSGLNEQDIQRMVKEASEHEREDKERREQIERRNNLDNLCYSLEKTIRENREKLPTTDVSALEALIKEGRDAVERQDDGMVRGALERLEHESHRVAQTLYQNVPGADAPPGAGPPPPPQGEPKKEGVIDAEFEDTHH
jgi:molecular chaperone DnaK